MSARRRSCETEEIITAAPICQGTAILAGAAWVDPRHASRAGQLMALHDFNEELNSVIGLTTLYSQALGSVSACWVYDSMGGHEGPKRHKSID